MSNNLAHGLAPAAACRTSTAEIQIRVRVAGGLLIPSGLPRRKPLLSTTSLDHIMSAARSKTLRGVSKVARMASQSVLAPGLAGKFKLDADSELQVAINAPTPGSLMQIEFHITNGGNSLVLHWGAIRQRETTNWAMPSRQPSGTKVYNNQALRTPFAKSGQNSFLKIEIDDPEIQAIEFLVVDESQNKWLKNNGQNFQVQLSWKDHRKMDVLNSGNLNVSVPEDLVQIQSYLRSERKGRRSYSPNQEKLEYEAARTELLEEINKGTSIEELRAKLIKDPNGVRENIVNPSTQENDIPDDLVQVQAFIRWERAGKPNYSPEKQHVEFEEARRELQQELDKGTSLTEIRKRIIKRNFQTEISKQLQSKKYFTVERIQRKKRDVTELLNKYASETVGEKIPDLPRAPTVIELFSNTIEEQDGGSILNKKIFKIDNKEFLVLVTKPLGKTKVYMATDRGGPLILHWGLSKKAGEWMEPPFDGLPQGSVLLGKSCETPFIEASYTDKFYQAVEIEIDGKYDGMPFVLRSDGYWIKNSNSDFYVAFVSQTTESRTDAGDGRGTAKALLYKIAEMESDAQRSFMHRSSVFVFPSV